MASSYSPLKVELIGTGEQAGTWGTTTNTNLGTALEEAITGRATATFPTDANYTLPYLDSNSSQVFRNLVLNVTSSGNLGATRDLIIPAIEKQYIVENNTSGGQSIRVKTAAGTGVTIPNGKIANVYCNGTNTRFADDFVGITGGTISGVSLSLSSALPVTQGGTGLATATQGDIIYASASNTYAALPKNTTATRYLANTGTSNNPAWAQINLLNGVVNALPVANGGTGLATLTANNVLLGNGTAALQAVAPGTTGNLLTSNGTTWVSSAPPTSFIAGMIIMWSGTIATIPTGWALCNGLNGTPDLRDRFIIGASQDSGGVARTNVTGSLTQTGGSKDAIVVSHTHTASSSVSDPGHTHTANIVNEILAGGPFSTVRPVGAGSGTIGMTTSTTGITVSTSVSSTGSSGTNANLPPYYALAFIMKT